MRITTNRTRVPIASSFFSALRNFSFSLSSEINVMRRKTAFIYTINKGIVEVILCDRYRMIQSLTTIARIIGPIKAQMVPNSVDNQQLT